MDFVCKSKSVFTWSSRKKDTQSVHICSPLKLCLSSNNRVLVCACVCACVCMCQLSSLSRRQLLVCVCMYMYANTPERLRLHKAVNLLCIKNSIVFQYNYTMQASQSVACLLIEKVATLRCCNLNNPHNENHSENTLLNCVSSSIGWCVM